MSSENCLVCQIIAGEIPSSVIHEDEKTLSIIDVNGSNPGHCFVMPKEHFTIMEQMPDDLIADMFNVSNVISSAIFETLKVEGTNIFVTNGVAAGQTVAHFMINIIPRKDKDGINLQWEPKTLSEEEMATVELKLKEATQHIGVQGKRQQAAASQEDKEAQPPVIDEENYLLRQLRRLP